MFNLVFLFSPPGMLLCKNLRVDLHSSELRISGSISEKHSHSILQIVRNSIQNIKAKPGYPRILLTFQEQLYIQSSHPHTNTDMQSSVGEKLFVVLRPFLQGQFGDLHNGGAGLWKSAHAVIFALAVSMWSVICHTDSRSSRTRVSNNGFISDIQHRGYQGIIWVLIKVPLPEGAMIRVYTGLRFLLSHLQAALICSFGMAMWYGQQFCDVHALG